MELYAQYRREKDNAEVIYDEEGFIVFQIVGDLCHIGEIYVRPEYRNQGVASKMARLAIDAAKQKGCKSLTCTILFDRGTPEENIRKLEAWGFKKTYKEGIFLGTLERKI